MPPDINISLTRNLPFDSEVRQWRHPLTTSLHCLIDQSNTRTRGQFEYDITWFCFYFDFVRSNARWKEAKRKARQRKGKPDKINELILKTKTDLKEGHDNLITYKSHSWIMFSFHWLFITWRGEGWEDSFEIGHPKTRGWKKFGRTWTRGLGTWILDNFHGRHMCLISLLLYSGFLVHSFFNFLN